MVAQEVDPERLVFVDEMGAHTSLAPLYGYPRKGERLHLQVPRNRGKNTTLLASITLGGMGETMAVEGSTNQEVFDAYVEHVLAPTLEAGEVVIMDNLSLPTNRPG
jgi:ABC-type cobalamin transport system ATPase subunit